ncbi:MAG: hypothetical protein KHZ15_02435 [Coprobacillus cateniformis]|uniref:Uncharacterized protein n=1 Tax=Longibaculum muris TaxID=1796628 RepID=A0A4R3Z5R9_9FIRM|nr:hypothetical protein [Longibaculum muris]KXU50736.1 hypothetical protein HMPREF3037_01177 [Candidatus Stoquefichus sp. KLE1796]MBS5111527.1 hypothetical protein [Coprobacillus cateniformis]MBS5370375.1 hypothetical protein [Coprobacillus cateniformis]MCR1887330.1 hypothetical protein [Longibaculum muris]MED9812289.1 hypothetical protein [Longibaculum muris]
MNFEWSTNDIATMTLTIYETNLTLNKAACTHFEDVNYVLLGVDKSARQIGIKPVSKQEIDDQIYPESQLHRISLGKSYGRISNKSFVYDLSQEFGLDFENNQCYKYKVTYDVVHSIMIAQL